MEIDEYYTPSVEVEDEDFFSNGYYLFGQYLNIKVQEIDSDYNLIKDMLLLRVDDFSKILSLLRKLKEGLNLR